MFQAACGGCVLRQCEALHVFLCGLIKTTSSQHAHCLLMDHYLSRTPSLAQFVSCLSWPDLAVSLFYPAHDLNLYLSS